MFRKHMVSKLCAAAILCSGEEVSAQTIFKQTDATGHTTFTDRPAAESMMVLYETESSHQHTLPPPRIATGTRSDVANALSSNAAMASTYAATVDFNEARRRLKQARETRQAGMEPRPGEGTGAMNKRYQNRQRRLEREVVAAERRSHETSLARSALLRSDDGKTDPLKLAQP